ncbi:hypothetical protein LXL04_020019 [Taraxacum kok-saghyz]
MPASSVTPAPATVNDRTPPSLSLLPWTNQLRISGVIFVHGLSQRRTKTSLKKWAAEIAATGTFSAPLANGGPGGLPVPYLVVGNKADVAAQEGTRGSSGNLVDMARQWAAKEARYDIEAVLKFFRMTAATELRDTVLPPPPSKEHHVLPPPPPLPQTTQPPPPALDSYFAFKNVIFCLPFLLSIATPLHCASPSPPSTSPVLLLGAHRPFSEPPYLRRSPSQKPTTMPALLFPPTATQLFKLVFPSFPFDFFPPYTDSMRTCTIVGIKIKQEKQIFALMVKELKQMDSRLLFLPDTPKLIQVVRCTSSDFYFLQVHYEGQAGPVQPNSKARPDVLALCGRAIESPS